MQPKYFCLLMFFLCTLRILFLFFFFQAEDGIRDRSPSRGLGDVYKRQLLAFEQYSGAVNGVKLTTISIFSILSLERLAARPLLALKVILGLGKALHSAYCGKLILE